MPDGGGGRAERCTTHKGRVAAEVHARCITPWEQPETASEKQERALNAWPNFLKSGTGSSSSKTSNNAVADESRSLTLRPHFE